MAYLEEGHSASPLGQKKSAMAIGKNRKTYMHVWPLCESISDHMKSSLNEILNSEYATLYESMDMLELQVVALRSSIDLYLYVSQWILDSQPQQLRSPILIQPRWR